jgi:hypothetical protein
MTKKNLLLALVPESVPIITTALGNEFVLTFCTSMEEATSMLNGNVDLIAASTHFDKSRMFDLLRNCKAAPETRDIPFLCLRLLGGELDDSIYEGVEIAARALGAIGFIDLFRLRRKLGEERANEELRQCIRRHAGGTA